MTDADREVLSPFQPHDSPTSKPFWDAVAAGRLDICRCADCGHYIHPPLPVCPPCGGSTRFETVSGQGRLYSFTVTHHQAVPAELYATPYTVGVIELVEQPNLRIVAPVIGDGVHVDQPVQIEFQPLAGGSHFVPVARCLVHSKSADQGTT